MEYLGGCCLNMAPLVNMRGLEKDRQQKKQTEPHETARLHSSFLFALTTEGALL